MQVCSSRGQGGQQSSALGGAWDLGRHAEISNFLTWKNTLKGCVGMVWGGQEVCFLLCVIPPPPHFLELRLGKAQGMAQTLQAELAFTKKPWALIALCHGQQWTSLRGATRIATSEASPFYCPERTGSGLSLVKSLKIITTETSMALKWI